MTMGDDEDIAGRVFVCSALKIAAMMLSNKVDNLIASISHFLR